MKTALMNKSLGSEDEEELWLASEKYIRGEITTEELKKIEDQYSAEPIKDIQRTSVLDFLKDVLTHQPR